ncbi:MAG TPA: hypothetical protein ENK46_01035 [Flavobacteriia bacterium]|nr:hypothetical protein [Flavobacteriia bacterium]
MANHYKYFLIFLFVFQSVSAQFSVGVSYGIQIPGRQDLKFRRYENTVLQENIKTTYVQTNITPVLTVDATYWINKYGIRLSYFEWEHISTAKEFLTDERPPFFRIEQSREAFYVSILRKSSFPFLPEEQRQTTKKYTYFGIGIGETLTEVERGRTQWRAAFLLSYSLSIPIVKKIRAIAAFKFLLTRDIDTLPNKDGWFVDTSGRWHPFRFGPHWDTKYHVFQVGLQWEPF